MSVLSSLGLRLTCDIERIWIITPRLIVEKLHLSHLKVTPGFEATYWTSAIGHDNKTNILQLNCQILFIDLVNKHLALAEMSMFSDDGDDDYDDCYFTATFVDTTG